MVGDHSEVGKIFCIISNLGSVYTKPNNLPGRHEKLFRFLLLPIRYMRLHFRDRRGRNPAEITVRMCEQKPYPLWFSCRSRAVRYSLNTRMSSNVVNDAFIFQRFLFALQAWVSKATLDQHRPLVTLTLLCMEK